VAETKTAFLTNLMSPFGMALVGDSSTSPTPTPWSAFPYQAGQTQITAAPRKLDGPARRPQPPLDQEPGRQPGRIAKLYVGVGSNSNVADFGMGEELRAARRFWEIDRMTGASASTRRACAIRSAWPGSRTAASCGSRSMSATRLGNDLVPDYMTSVTPGAFYGWPYSYYGQNVDERVKPQNPALVASAIKPDYALGAHTASLGLTFSDSTTLPAAFRNGAFVGQHGSWNRSVPNGYKVIFVPFANGVPAGTPQDVLTGFLNAQGEAQGRPVGVQTDRTGALLVADDVGNVIWRVSSAN
jgi:glucose/arabinose dehydrogenase